jgi:hypothetical protein
MHVAYCKGCQATIIWARTEGGKNMPLDYAPVTGGNIELREGVVTFARPDPMVARHISHYATCSEELKANAALLGAKKAEEARRKRAQLSLWDR